MCVRSFKGLFFYCKSMGPIAVAAISSLELMRFLAAANLYHLLFIKLVMGCKGLQCSLPAAYEQIKAVVT